MGITKSTRRVLFVVVPAGLFYSQGTKKFSELITTNLAVLVWFEGTDSNIEDADALQ